MKINIAIYFLLLVLGVSCTSNENDASSLKRASTQCDCIDHTVYFEIRDGVVTPLDYTRDIAIKADCATDGKSTSVDSQLDLDDYSNNIRMVTTRICQ